MTAAIVSDFQGTEPETTGAKPKLLQLELRVQDGHLGL